MTFTPDLGSPGASRTLGHPAGFGLAGLKAWSVPSGHCTVGRLCVLGWRPQNCVHPTEKYGAGSAAILDGYEVHCPGRTALHHSVNPLDSAQHSSC